MTFSTGCLCAQVCDDADMRAGRVLARSPEPLRWGSGLVTDAGMRHVRGLSKLRELQIGARGHHRCRTGLPQFAPPARIAGYEVAELYGCQLAARAGIDPVAGVRLRQRPGDRRGTFVSERLDAAPLARPRRRHDDGRRAGTLAGLTQLQNLNLTDCKRVTDAGVKKLQQALPNCQIYRPPTTPDR